jgi:transposase
MQGKKQYRDKLLLCFRLSDCVPKENFYRRLNDQLDLKWLCKAMQPYYGTEGHRSIDPVVFIKLMLIGYLENIISDRHLLATASMRLFVGYKLDEPLPWHSTVSRTRQLFGETVFSQLFQQVLQQCIDQGMVAGRRQGCRQCLCQSQCCFEQPGSTSCDCPQRCYGGDYSSSTSPKG